MPCCRTGWNTAGSLAGTSPTGTALAVDGLTGDVRPGRVTGFRGPELGRPATAVTSAESGQRVLIASSNTGPCAAAGPVLLMTATGLTLPSVRLGKGAKNAVQRDPVMPVVAA